MLASKNITRLLARYSDGLRLTVDHGPRSGLVCEYACRNQPHGSGLIGRWIDRQFLRASTWDGLRQRVQSTKSIVAEIIAGRRAHGRTTMVLDVAAGTARYLREVVRECGGADVIVAAHDRNPREVELGRELVAREGLPNLTFAVGDATDHSSYLTSRDPDIILAIGLFAHLPQDAAVRTVMQLAFEHLSSGGCFVCTTLATPRVGDPDAYGARPAARPPEVVARWLRETGFVKIDQRFSQPKGFALMGWKRGSE